ncbi:hypothetical protein AUC43_01245 [Hymenobacter sedentarius]|uniref:TonB-dependent receptor plug domain-containing protein n=1 Tax=Hymenobacter sedentarius TaxID=1411621 RepID=A0A0U3SCH0_9BACT|nr:carboxypeptidase-like regulatory domain-containing protein [Hymenobacter sedentarius]ALW83846.1 hypothetical protein AUC43_01245 [Hymenobacter sedentarius]
MRSSLLLAVTSLLILALSLTGPRAQAQSKPASKLLLASAAPVGSRPAAVGNGRTSKAASPSSATKVVSGRVMGPAGVQVGAVVEVAGTEEATVTNANGEFSLTVPDNGSPVQLVASYAGFADETTTIAADDCSATLKLSTAQPVTCTIARRQGMKAYLKTAHRQARRSLRSIK